jgi:ribosomal protein S12
MAKSPDTAMWEFIKIFRVGGTTVYPGIVIKGDLIETDDTVSIRGSEVFKDIPKDILKPHTPPLPATRRRKSNGA